MRRAKDYLLLYLKGMAMGTGDVVAGVSGATVAFITGIYNELIFSLREVDTQSARLLLRFRLREFWNKINGNFILVVFAGILTSLFTLAKLVLYLQQNHSIKISSFFFGLILIAALLTLRNIKKWNALAAIAILSGIGIGYALTRLGATPSPSGAWFILIAGFMSGFTMLIPGVSATFFLLLVEKLNFISAAVSEFRIGVLLTFIAGCTAGIISFSRFLGFFLKNYPGATLALLAGFMLGSLNKIWPWREVLEYVTSSGGQQVPVFVKSILPWNYFEITGKDPQVFQAILMMALGVFIVVLVEKFAARLKTKI